MRVIHKLFPQPIQRFMRSLVIGLTLGVGTIGFAQAEDVASLMNGDVARGFNGAALPSIGSLLDGQGVATPTIGWVQFCSENPQDCRVSLHEPEVVTLNTTVWRSIVSVNTGVNQTIKPMSDREHWGVEESWNYPTDGYGDCEDYALLKRKQLVKMGVPARTMRITVVLDEKREGHAVLTLRTNHGDFILDNKKNAILPWQRTGYITSSAKAKPMLGGNRLVVPKPPLLWERSDPFAAHRTTIKAQDDSRASRILFGCLAPTTSDPHAPVRQV
jgi:predicted transglutaminase-like cysteine proteinase